MTEDREGVERDAGPSGPGESRSGRPGPSEARPLIQRIGMALVAILFAALFGGVALAAYAGGELFLGTMAAIGCAMTLWVGGLTLLRG